PGCRPAHRPRVPGGVLAVGAAAVALVAATGVAVVGAGCAGGALRVGRTRGARSRAELGGVALTGRGAAEGRGGEEGIGRAGRARAVAGLGLVAVPGRRPAHRPRIPRRMLAVAAAAVAGVGRARVAVVGAGGAGSALRVGRTVGVVAGTALGQVTLAGGGATLRARGDEGVRRARSVHAVAGLGHVAVARRGAADRARRLQLADRVTAGARRTVRRPLVALLAGGIHHAVAARGGGGGHGVAASVPEMAAEGRAAVAEVARQGAVSHVDDDLDPVVDRFLASMVLRRRVDDSEIRTVVAVVDAAGGEHEIVRHVAAHVGGLAAADEALAALRLRRRALPIAAGRTARAEVRACRPLAGDVRPVRDAAAILETPREERAARRDSGPVVGAVDRRGARKAEGGEDVVRRVGGVVDRRRIGDHDLQERRGDAREARGGRITAVAARADIGTADGGQALGAEGPDVQGTRVAGAVAGFVLIAVVGRRPAHRARMSRRVLAVVAAAITLVAAAGVAVVAAGPAGGALRVGGAAGARSRAELRGVAFAGRGAAERRRREEGIGGTRGARAVAGLGHVAVARGRPAHRTGIPRGVLAVVPAAVAGVDRARVPVIGAGGVRGLLRVDRAVGAVPGTVLGEVALAIGRAADDARGLEAIGGTAVADAVAGLGRVAVPGRRPAHRPRVPRGVLAVVPAAVAGVGRARVAVVGAGRAARPLPIRRAVGAVAGTALGQVALAIGRAADDARGLEVVGGTAVAGAVAGLDRVAGTSRGAADRAGRALGIRGARRAGARAGLGDVAVPGGRAAHRAPILCRMLAVIAAAVALVAAARIAIVGARGTRGALRVGRTRGARSRAQLCGIALAGRGAAERRGGEEGV